MTMVRMMWYVFLTGTVLAGKDHCVFEGR